jgi:hypothetical protein
MLLGASSRQTTPIQKLLSKILANAEELFAPQARP